MAAEPQLLDESIRRKLSQLMLSAGKVRAGAIKGERRSTKRGTSIEFADYRSYTPGDDLRRLDWNIYARTDRPYIKLLEDEEDLAVHLLLDASSSMNWPQESDGVEDTRKLLFGKRVLAGLGYIALLTNDQLTITALNDAPRDGFGPVRGRGQSVAMLRYLRGIEASGVTDLNGALAGYARRARRSGLCIIVSDLFSPSGHEAGIKALQARGHEVVLIHTLSPDEVTPPLVGDLRLVDVETGRAQEVTLDPTLRELYARRLTEWRDGIQADCRRKGIHYLPVVTDLAWEKVILYELRKVGVIR